MEESSQPAGDTGGTPDTSTSAASPAAPPPSPPTTSKTGPITASDFSRAASAARTDKQPGDEGSTAPPDTQTPVTAPVPAAPGPVPYDRFHEVNQKYEKTRWAETYQSPEEVAQSVQLARWLDADPKGAHAFITQMLQQHGLIAPPSLPQAPAQESRPSVDQLGRPLPDVPVEGTDLTLYSAQQAQALVDWALKQMDERLKPFQDDRKKMQEAAHRQRVWQQASTQASSMVQEAETWPGFTEHMADIQSVMESDKRLSLHTAYQRVVGPKLEQYHREKFVKEQRERSNGSVHNPGTPAAPSTKELRKLSMAELFSREMSRRGLGR